MIKKLALVGLITLSLVGCTNNDNTNVDPSGDTTTQEENAPDITRDVEYYTKSENAKDLVDRDINEVFGELDRPHRATYYVNADDINIININDDKESVIGSSPAVTEYVYPRISDKKSALYVYTDKNTITETRVGEFAQVPNNDYRDTDYRVNYYYDYTIVEDNDFNLKKYKDEFIGKNIDEFNKKNNLESPSIEVFKKGTVDKLNIYTIEDGNKALLVHSKDNIIKDMKEVGQNITKDVIDDYFGK